MSYFFVTSFIYIGLWCLVSGAMMMIGDTFDMASCQAIMIDLVASGLLVMILNKIQEVVKEVGNP
jgi:hypothetical protein